MTLRNVEPDFSHGCRIFVFGNNLKLPISFGVDLTRQGRAAGEHAQWSEWGHTMPSPSNLELPCATQGIGMGDDVPRWAGKSVLINWCSPGTFSVEISAYRLCQPAMV